MTKSVCVIGAGIGGLTAAAYLAQHGYTVTVLEKATTVGGSAGYYVRKGHVFPTGATIAFGLEEGGLLRTVLQELGIDLQARALSHPMDVVLSDRRVSIFQDPQQWEKELKQKFPAQTDSVVRFWKHLSNIANIVLKVTETKASLPFRRLADLGTFPSYALRNPLSVLHVARHANDTVGDLLRQYGLEQDVAMRELLNAQLIDAVQTDVENAALLPASVALTIYRRGSYYVENGIGQISEELAKRVIQLGGNVKLKTPVTAIRRDEEKKKWIVEGLKFNCLFDVVINNTGISFDSEKPNKEEASWGAFRLDAIVKKTVWEDGLEKASLPFALQIVPDPTCSRLFGDDHGPVYVTFNEAVKANGEEAEGEIMMTVSIHTIAGDWLSLSKEDYKLKKERAVSALLGEIEKVVPVKENLLYLEAGSPLTYKKFVGKAEVGGSPLTVKNAILRPKGVRGGAAGLYNVGESVFPGPGTLSSALSGYYAARAIKKEHRL